MNCWPSKVIRSVSASFICFFVLLWSTLSIGGCASVGRNQERWHSSSITASDALQGEQTGKITLPGGDVVWNLNGKWDAYIEYRGIWSQYRPVSTNVTIRQEGFLFEVVLDSEMIFFRKGSVVARGELNKRALKNLMPIHCPVLLI